MACRAVQLSARGGHYHRRAIRVLAAVDRLSPQLESGAKVETAPWIGPKRTYLLGIPSIISIPGPMLAAWNFMKKAMADDRDKRDFRAETSLLDTLRHADYNSHKYITSLFMKSGRTIVGRIGTGPYDHESHVRHRGTLTILSEREYPEGVFYEVSEVRISQVEGYLLQDVSHASPEVIKRLRNEAEEIGDIGPP